MSKTSGIDQRIAMMVRNAPLFSDRVFSADDMPPVSKNMVVTVHYGVRIYLHRIVQTVPHAEWDSARFAAAIVRQVPPKCCALFFASGKVVLSGCRSIHEVEVAVHKYAALLRSTGHNVVSHTFKVQNCVMSASVPYNIDLKRLHLENAGMTAYQPKDFPGLIYKISDPKVAVIIFNSGKFNIVGFRNQREGMQAYEIVMRSIPNYRAINLSSSASSRRAVSSQDTQVEQKIVKQLLSHRTKFDVRSALEASEKQRAESTSDRDTLDDTRKRTNDALKSPSMPVASVAVEEDDVDVDVDVAQVDDEQCQDEKKSSEQKRKNAEDEAAKAILSNISKIISSSTKKTKSTTTVAAKSKEGKKDETKVRQTPDDTASAKNVPMFNLGKVSTKERDVQLTSAVANAVAAASSSSGAKQKKSGATKQVPSSNLSAASLVRRQLIDDAQSRSTIENAPIDMTGDDSDDDKDGGVGGIVTDNSDKYEQARRIFIRHRTRPPVDMLSDSDEIRNDGRASNDGAVDDASDQYYHRSINALNQSLGTMISDRLAAAERQKTIVASMAQKRANKSFLTDGEHLQQSLPKKRSRSTASSTGNGSYGATGAALSSSHHEQSRVFYDTSMQKARTSSVGGGASRPILVQSGGALRTSHRTSSTSAVATRKRVRPSHGSVGIALPPLPSLPGGVDGDRTHSSVKRARSTSLTTYAPNSVVNGGTDSDATSASREARDKQPFSTTRSVPALNLDAARRLHASQLAKERSKPAEIVIT